MCSSLHTGTTCWPRACVLTASSPTTLNKQFSNTCLHALLVHREASHACLPLFIYKIKAYTFFLFYRKCSSEEDMHILKVKAVFLSRYETRQSDFIVFWKCRLRKPSPKASQDFRTHTLGMVLFYQLIFFVFYLSLFHSWTRGESRSRVVSGLHATSVIWGGGELHTSPSPLSSPPHPPSW